MEALNFVLSVIGTWAQVWHLTGHNVDFIGVWVRQEGTESRTAYRHLFLKPSNVSEKLFYKSQGTNTRDITCHPDESNMMSERGQTQLGYKPTTNCVPWNIKSGNLSPLMHQYWEVGSEPSWILNVSLVTWFSQHGYNSRHTCDHLSMFHELKWHKPHIRSQADLVTMILNFQGSRIMS